LALSLSRGRLAGLVRNLEDTLVRAVPKDDQAVALLKSYLGALDDLPAQAAPELAELISAHLYDLAGLALGAAGDAAALARDRGVRAARLAAAKAFVRRHLHRADLRADSVAVHLGVTPRYVHMLFEPDGLSFLEYVLTERLARVYRVLLSDPTRSVSAVAFATGFGDLSHFNRTFPPPVRAHADGGAGGGTARQSLRESRACVVSSRVARLDAGRPLKQKKGAARAAPSNKSDSDGLP
jgi:AraC-like DNA-binding protein